MLDLQSALNVGEGFYFDSEDWMEIEIENKRRELDSRPDWPISLVERGRREACVIDPLLGTSVKLLSVMVPSLLSLHATVTPRYPSTPDSSDSPQFVLITHRSLSILITSTIPSEMKC